MSFTLEKNKLEKIWLLPVQKIFSLVESSPEGLSSTEAEKRLADFGPNQVEDHKSRSAWEILILQLQNWLVITLLIATVIAFFLGEKIESLVIVGIVILSVFFGFFQEYRAEKSLEKLKKYLTQRSLVFRDGKWLEIDSRKIVVGDIVQLRMGDRVPADLRLFEINALTADEAILTGESMPVAKRLEPINKDEASIPEQKNLLFASTYIASGIAKGVIFAAGKDTYIGKTAKLLESRAPLTDFQKQTQKFSVLLFKVILGMTAFVFLANVLLHKGLFNSFLFALALAVGVTPELLPMIITVTLSEGALLLAKKKVVVKRLMSIEDLGNVDTLCIDKTGTLTEGSFSLSDFQTLAGEKNPELLTQALLCSDGFKHQGKGIFSNQIDQALWESPKTEAARKSSKFFRLLDEHEFDFTRKRMSVIVQEKNTYWFIAKGAVESILAVSKQIIFKNKLQNLTPQIQKQIEKQVYTWEKSGFRVIALAKKKTILTKTFSDTEKDLIFQGFLLFSSPVKKSIQESLELFKNLGVKLKVLSGDSPVVVKRVALETGLASEKTPVISAEEISRLNDQELKTKVQNFSLFARVDPEQKYRIVSSLNQENHIVGFLGDGVNDAPALQAADVGIAVDSGAAVAKEAADIVLLEKNLLVLGEGIEIGRKTFGNIMKYILNTISANFGNMFTVAASSLFLRFIPLLPSQILLNNFISDVPLLAVATDNVDRGFISRPKRWNLKFISKFMIYFGLISSFFDMALILPLIFLWHANPEVFRTAWFVESSLSEMIVTFAIRTRLWFFQSLPSKWLIGLSIISGFLVMILPFLAIGQYLFHFVSLPMSVAIWIGLVLLTYFLVVEVVKFFFFRKFDL